MDTLVQSQAKLQSGILKVVSATFLLVCFACLKENTCEKMKNFFISLRKLFSFSK